MIRYLLFLLLPLTLFGQSQKISDMTSATSLTGSEYVPIVQTTNKKATVGLLRGWTSLGTAGQLLKVNSGATALEFFTPSYLSTYPGAGIPLSTGSAWGTSITDNSATWNTAITTTGTQALTGNKIVTGSGSNYNLALGDASLGELGTFTVLTSGSTSISSLTASTSSLNVGGYTGSLRNGPRGYEASPTGIFIFANAGQYIEGDVTGFKFVLGSDATGDTYYRNSSGYFTRLPAGTNGHVLTLAAGIPSWAAPSGGGWALTGTSTLTGASTIIGTTTNKLDFQFASLGTTYSGVFKLTNPTAAAAGAQQAMNLTIRGNGWKTNATAASQTVDGIFNVLPVQGAANPTATLQIGYAINGAAPTYPIFYEQSNNYVSVPNLVATAGIIQLNSSRILLFNGGAGEIRADLNAGLIFRSNATTTVPTGGYYRFYNSAGSYTATSGTLNMMGVESSFAPTSGTGVFNAYLGSGTINQTGGANGVVSMLKLTPVYTATGGDVNGYYYDPTVTSVGGVNYAIHATSGKTLVGGTTITSNTHHDFRGGSSTDKILRLADGSNNELFTFKADKEYEVTQTNGKYQERQPTGTTSATVYAENIYSSSDISDGQSVTIEVLWTAKDSGANTGAGGVFYTTWTKASGTLAKAGDNQLVTNDNMSGSWALSTSDSSGAISLTFTGTGVANTEISLVTRIIKSN